MKEKVSVLKNIVIATAAAALALGAAAASAAAPKGNAATPSNWSYEIRNGQRVPKATRVVQADGSWVEETKQGNCVVTRTGRDGEVREVRKCE
jgi:hypothetical protein